MRLLAIAVLIATSGCAQLLGLEDPPAGTTGDDGPACTIDEQCGAHQYCTAEQTCACVAGYADAAGACMWSGVVRAPGFDSIDEWITTDGTIDPSFVDPDTKMVDRGVARFTSANGCGGTIEQTFLMPRFSRAEPLVAEIHYRSADASDTNPANPFGVSFQLGTGWVENIDRGEVKDWPSRRVCLGAAHFAPESTTGAGAQTTLVIPRPTSISTQCPQSFEFDRFDIMPASPGECPSPGSVLNGDANDVTGWAFHTEAAATVGFVSSGGEGDSPAVKFTAPTRCDYSGATVQVSPGVADATSSPRFSFFSKHQSSMPIALGVNGVGSYWIGTNTTMALTKACVPAPLRGVAWPMSFDYKAGMINAPGGPGNCQDLAGSVTLDTVAVAADDTCGHDPYIADAGFESDYQLATAFPGPPNQGGYVRKAFDTARAHTGRGFVEMGVPSCNPAPIMDIEIATPPPNGTTTMGPAVKFWYRATSLDSMTQFSISSPVQTVKPMNFLGWNEAKVCLDPKKLPGRSQKIRFAMLPFHCGVTLTDNILIDDVTVTFDASCPL